MHAGAIANEPKSDLLINQTPSANPAFVWDRDGHKQASFDGGKDYSVSRATPNSLADEIDIGVIPRSEQAWSREPSMTSRSQVADAAIGKRPRSSVNSGSEQDLNTTAKMTNPVNVSKLGSVKPSAAAAAAPGASKKKTATTTASHLYK